MHGDRPAAESCVQEFFSLPEHFRAGIWGHELRRLRMYLAVYQGRWEEARRVIAETGWTMSNDLALLLISVETDGEGADQLFLGVFATKGHI